MNRPVKEKPDSTSENEQPFKMIFEEGLLGIVMVGPDFKFINVNPAFCNLTGYSKEELASLSFKDITHPDHIIKDTENIKALISGELSSYKTEKRYIRKDGTIIWANVNATIIRNKSGKFQHLLAMIEDITAAKRAEELLQKSEDSFRSLFENMTEGVALHEVIYNEKGRAVNYRIMEVNPAYEKHTGISPVMAKGKLATELYGTDTAPYLPLWAKVAETGKPHFMEVNFEPLKKSFNIACCSPRKGWFATVFTDITEKKRAEEQLVQSEEKFRSLVETTSDWIWESDTNAVYTYSGPQIETLLGYKPAEVVGRKPYDFMPEDETDRLRKILADRFIGRKPYKNLEYKYRHRNGSIVILESSGVPLFSTNGKLMGYRGIDRDITDRSLTEEKLNAARQQLAASENQFRSLFDHAGEGILVADTETHRFVLANPAICRMLGYSAEELTGKSVHEIHPKESLPMVLATFKAQKNGEQLDAELPCQKKDGNVIYANINATPVVIHGKTFLIGLFSDITSRKLDEQALKESRIHLQGILDSTADGILAVDSAGKVIHSNRHFAKMWRIPESTINAGDDNALLDVVLEQLQDSEPFLSKVKQLYNSTAIDTDFLHFKDGRIFERYSAPMILDNRIVGRVWSFRDITIQRKAEESIRLLNRELEQRVKERTIELETANRELQAFAYSVSHDLRAPLRSIDGFSTAILEDYSHKLDTEGRDYLLRLRRASQRMGALIDDLLKLSRVTSIEMNFSTVDLSLVVANIISDLRESDRLRDVETIIAPQITVKADPQLITTVMENLVGNSWKFTSKRQKAKIEFGVTISNSAPAYFVRDNGAGFDMAFSKKLFGAFQRLHDVEEYPGDGIGLASAQRVIHRHGGRIWAEATPNEGATFYFTLGS